MISVVETTDLATCHALRRKVFIEEQAVPEEDELDDRDEGAVHLLASVGDRPMGSARLLLEGATATIGRVCVVPEARGTGLGRTLMLAALDSLRARGITRAELGAQCQAIGFYEALGFVAEGPEYMDAGIAHRHMILPL